MTGHYTIFWPIKNNSQIDGVVLYYHPTIFGNYNGPTEKSAYWRSLGMFYAAQNYILILPHLIGFNGDGIPHPYIFYPAQTIGYGMFCLNDAF